MKWKKTETNCEVCNLEPSIGVACVPALPVSVAYGEKCLSYNAHPFELLKSNVICCGGPGNVGTWFLDGLNTFVDGKYMTLRLALELHPITMEELDLSEVC
jgi:hypothetical protein